MDYSKGWTIKSTPGSKKELPGAKKSAPQSTIFLHKDKYGQSLMCQLPPSKHTANTAAAAGSSPTPPPTLPTPSPLTAVGQQQMPRCHHLANRHRHHQCHRTNIAASPTATYKEEIASVTRAQQCTHWEGEKFDVIATARTKTAVVAVATAMHWGGRTSRQGQGRLMDPHAHKIWPGGVARRGGRRSAMTTMFNHILGMRGKEWLGLRPCRLRWAEPSWFGLRPCRLGLCPRGLGWALTVWGCTLVAWAAPLQTWTG
jgi:hypothetical protein